MIKDTYMRCERMRVAIHGKHIRWLSRKFADTTNKTRIVYHRLMKFCINKYQLSSISHTKFDWMFLKVDWCIGHGREQGYGARSTSQLNVYTLISIHFKMQKTHNQTKFLCNKYFVGSTHVLVQQAPRARLVLPPFQIDSNMLQKK